MRPQRNGDNVSPLGVGVITIFMVMIVLCLSLLSTLALSTARGDLRLSQINAETVSAYYQADAQAAQLYARFVADGQDAFEVAIPMTESQFLYVSFGRDAAGSATILAWKTMSAYDESGWGEWSLPVWQGD